MGKNKSKSANNNSADKTKKAVVRSAPIAVTTSRKAVDKKITQKGDLVTIHHRELLVSSYVASSQFSVDSRIALNPGLSSYSSGSPMGTWLPSIAKNYDRYRFKKLMFHFTTYAATTTPGMIVMSYDPNPENANPSTLAEAQNSFFRNGSIHDNVTFDVTSKLPTDFKFTRSGPVTTLTTYDAGFVNFSSIGSTGTAVGLIEVEYVVEFKQPQSGTSGGVSLPSSPLMPMQIIETRIPNGTTAQVYETALSGGDVFVAQAMMNTNTVTYGQPLIEQGFVMTATQQTGGNWVYPNGSSRSPGTVNSVTFNALVDATNYPIGGLARPFFRFPYPGRYRIDVEAPWDIGIQSTAGYGLFGFKRLPATGPSPTWVSPLWEYSKLDGTADVIRYDRVFVQMGAENSSTSPKTAGDSTFRFTFELAANPDEYYALLTGTEVETLVAATCKLTTRGTVSPYPRFIITYLGPRLTETGLYDI